MAMIADRILSPGSKLSCATGMHPETTVLNISRSNDRFVREFYDEPRGFVFGFVADGPHHVSLESLRKARVVSFDLKRSPLIATFDETTFSTHLFSRRINDQELSFELVAAETPTTSVLMKDADCTPQNLQF